MNINIPEVGDPPSKLVLVVGALVVFAVFLGLAHMSRLFLDWSLSGAGIGFALGVIVTIGVIVAVAIFGGNTIKSLYLGYIKDRLSDGDRVKLQSYLCEQIAPK